MSEEKQAELVDAVRELLKLLRHQPEKRFERWCFESLSRDGARFDYVMDRIFAALPENAEIIDKGEVVAVGFN
jgi:hypothetical protein